MPLTGEAKRKYQREWRAKRRAEYFEGKSCEKCGATEGLELDHVDPTKKVSHNIWSWSQKRRDAELAKCQVLCKGHHREKTNAALMAGAEHGTRRKYKQGCHCVPCRGANAEYRKGNRARGGSC